MVFLCSLNSTQCLPPLPYRVNSGYSITVKNHIDFSYLIRFLYTQISPLFCARKKQNWREKKVNAVVTNASTMAIMSKRQMICRIYFSGHTHSYTRTFRSFGCSRGMWWCCWFVLPPPRRQLIRTHIIPSVCDMMPKCVGW